jgi:hypothetical protein
MVYCTVGLLLRRCHPLHNSHKSSTQACGSGPSPYDHDAAVVVVAPAPAATTQRWWGGHDPVATVGPRRSNAPRVEVEEEVATQQW